MGKIIYNKICFFVSTFAEGGIEKVYINLCNELCGRGIEVHLLIGRLASSEMVSQFDNQIKIVNLRSSHPYFCQPRLMRYLLKEKPYAVIADRHQSLIAAVVAKRILHASFDVYGTLHGNLSAMFERGWRNKRQQRGVLKKFENCLPFVNRIIAVSQGVSDDFLRFFPHTSEKLKVIYNPVVTPDLLEKSNEEVNHPWFNIAEFPVIMGVGRLSAQKDFSNLIRAFSEQRKVRKCRLIIVGSGEEEEVLIDLAENLGVRDDLFFAGFQKNPFSWMAHADLFVLSSSFEGLGNVLIEALAVGTTVVSTNCPSGPHEILEGGKYGALVPVGDYFALSAAIGAALDYPLDPEILRSRGQFFSVQTSADQYLQMIRHGKN